MSWYNLFIATAVVTLLSCSAKRDDIEAPLSTTLEDSVPSISDVRVSNNVEKAPSNYLLASTLIDFYSQDPKIVSEILRHSLPADLRVVRNEIFARKGYRFRDSLLYTHFSSFDWYNPKYSSIDSVLRFISANEKHVLDSIGRYEAINKGYNRDTLRAKLKEYLDGDSTESFSYILWLRVVDDYFVGNIQGSPWDLLRGYSLQNVEIVHNGIYHCILSYYCGAEGLDCTNQTVFTFDSEMNVLFSWMPGQQLHDVVRVGGGEFQYKFYADDDTERSGVYRIDRSGRIE